MNQENPHGTNSFNDLNTMSQSTTNTTNSTTSIFGNPIDNANNSQPPDESFLSLQSPSENMTNSQVNADHHFDLVANKVQQEICALADSLQPQEQSQMQGVAVTPINLHPYRQYFTTQQYIDRLIPMKIYQPLMQIIERYADQPNSNTFRQGLLYLGNTFSSSDASRYCQERNLIPYITKLLRESVDYDLQETILHGLGNLAAEGDPIFKQAIIKCNIIDCLEVVLSNLQAASRKGQIVQEISFLLSNLSNIENCSAYLYNTTVDSFIKLVIDNYKNPQMVIQDTLENTLQTLMMIIDSLEADKYTDFYTDEKLPMLITIIGLPIEQPYAQNADIVRDVVGILSNLLSGDDEIAGCLVELGVLETLTILLKESQDNEVLIKVVAAFTQLFQTDMERVEQILNSPQNSDYSIVRYLLTYCQHSDTQIREQALESIRYLISLCPEECLMFLLKNNVIQKILSALNETIHTNIVSAGLNALKELLDVSKEQLSSMDGQFDQVMYLIGTLNGEQKLNILEGHHSVDISARASDILSEYFTLD